MVKEKTTITLDRDVHKDLMLFKIQTNAGSLNDVIKVVIGKLREMLKEEEKSSQNGSNKQIEVNLKELDS